ncbi:MAG TPA: YMGG-like glycine zipper-containing protein [Pyrinomonadaceae bacterium]|nr:YMGG-like glycine zipper-containing protein [Pyrinomonadaceae bacterium]
MSNSKRIFSMFLLVTLSSIGLSAKAQRQSSRVNTRQVSNILRQLEQSSDRFRNSLSTSLDQLRSDETSDQNHIKSVERDFENATNQLRDRFNRRRSTADDVQNVLQRASRINDFMNRNRLSSQVQNDWAAVGTDLNALANAYGISWRWNQQTLPPVSTSQSYRLSDRELDQLIRRIETGGDTFRSSLTDAFDRSPYDQTRSEGSMNDAVRSFKKATDQLRNHFDIKQLVAGDVEGLIGQATPLERFMRNNQVTDRAQSDWSTLRGDLNTLASAFNFSSDWQNNPYPQTGYNANNRLTGTFRLDSSRSDNPRDKADRATQNVPDYERQVVFDQILARLDSPEMLAIERRGATVTIASSLAPQSTFEADGRERQEQLADGRSVRVTATLRGDQLVVNSNGYRENDFNVTFELVENERSLRVRRQIYSDRLTQPVVVDCLYDRTADAAQWNVLNGSEAYPTTGSASGDFIVRNGESVVAVLNTDLTTKQAKPGDRFAMTVRQPAEYEGAVIEGTVASVDRGGRISGRSAISLNFETIRLRNGQTYRFAGIIGSVRTVNGDIVQVDNEGGMAEGDSQTKKTVERGAIGTAVGAIIGAIAGGVKGAVIGAVVGAAGGAGSVYVQGKDDMELPSGTEVTIRASAPGR